MMKCPCLEHILNKCGLFFSAQDSYSFEEALAVLCQEDDMDLDDFDNIVNSTTSTTAEMRKTLLTVSYDMGWQRRSTGRKYNSLSGFGALVGNNGNKVLSFGVMQKDCRMCTLYTRKGLSVPEHKCHKNFDGSSKAMEPALAADLVQQLESNNNVQIENLIMDEDSTTITRIQETLGRKGNKWSDEKHVTNLFSNKLWKLKSKEMTADVITYFKRTFCIAVIDNRKNPDRLAQTLSSIVPHSFGDHSTCGSWCTYKENPTTYKPKCLPGGRYLQSESLKQSLSNVMQQFINKASQIAPGGSTRINKNLNHMDSHWCPKESPLFFEREPQA